MERNKVTTIDQLANGDRFYFVADKAKVVWQKVGRKEKRTKYRTYRYWALLASMAENAQRFSKTYMCNSIKAVNRETKIVYLRSTGVQITDQSV